MPDNTTVATPVRVTIKGKVMLRIIERILLLKVGGCDEDSVEIKIDDVDSVNSEKKKLQT